MSSTNENQEVLLSSPLRLSEPSLLRGRARLYRDHIVLAGWTWGGRFNRELPLTQVERVDWWTGDGPVNFTIQLQDGELISCKIRGAGRWKFEVEQCFVAMGRSDAGLPRADEKGRRILDAPAKESKRIHHAA